MMSEFLSRNLKWIIILFLTMFLFFQIRGCREEKLNTEIASLKGRVVAAEQALLEKDKKLEEMEKAHEEKINELNGAIDSANTIIAHLRASDAELEQTQSDLERAEATITDKDELIGNLRSQIETWRSRFNLARTESEEKDKIIFSITEKYEAERKLRIEISNDRNAWKTQYTDLRTLLEKTEGQLKKEKTLSRFEKIGLAVLAGVALVAIAK